MPNGVRAVQRVNGQGEGRGWSKWGRDGAGMNGSGLVGDGFHSGNTC